MAKSETAKTFRSIGRSMFTGGLAAAICLITGTAAAEVQTVRFARQLGLGYLQLYVAQDLKLVEKHAREAGLGDIAVSYAPLGSPSAINDALLSGSADFGGLNSRGTG
jgi:NitT/TauT family transport system substrate-binding protein